jgi:hypothetical protein
MYKAVLDSAGKAMAGVAGAIGGCIGDIEPMLVAAIMSVVVLVWKPNKAGLADRMTAAQGNMKSRSNQKRNLG